MTEMGVVGLQMVFLRGASTTFLFHRQVPDSPPVPVTLTSDLKMGERMRYPRVTVVSPGVISNHTATVFPDRQVVSLPRLQWDVTQGRVKLPAANMTQSACLAVKAQPHKHRPPLWAVMTASLYSVHCKRLPSCVFKPRSLDVCPAVKGWVDRLSGHTTMAVRPLLMLDTVRAGAGGGGVDTLEELVVSRCLCSFHVHVQSPGALLENPSECKWFPPAPGLSSAVIHALCFPHLLLTTRKLFFSSFPPSLPKTPSLSFLPVVSLLLPTSFGKSL